MKINKISLALTALFLFALFATVGFAASPDSILSSDLKEADGTTGQDTNAGAGVKSGHLQDSSVITSKIADGAVTTQKIGDNQITTQKLADGAVTGQKLGDASVTDAKIAGPISASKISSAGLNADTVDGLHAADLAPSVHTHSQSQVSGLESALAGKADVTHNHDTLYQHKYGKVAVVAQTGGDYSDPLTAMNNLSAWCGTPSATNPCLLKIMPGVYDIASNILQMQPYVDLEGSGETSTRIVGLPKNTEAPVLGLASNTEVRSLTVEVCGISGDYGIAIGSSMATSCRLINVTANASASSASSVAFYIWNSSLALINLTAKAVSENGWNLGMSINDATVLMQQVTVEASGGIEAEGIYLSNSSAQFRNITVSAPNPNGNGIRMNNGQAKIDHSSISGGQRSFVGLGGTFLVANSMLDGPLYFIITTVKCAGVYDGNYNFYSNTCP